MGEEAALFHLRPRFPALSLERLAEGVERVRKALAPRQLWLLSTRKGAFLSFEESPSSSGGKPFPSPSDPRPDPETLAASNERRSTLARALSRLPKLDRLLLRLRFDQDLTLEQIARLTGMESAQSVDRRIRRVLEELRQRMNVEKNDRGVRVSMTDDVLSELHAEEPGE
jgi:RNA polymerase sigma factor (sigma-70 family)